MRRFRRIISAFAISLIAGASGAGAQSASSPPAPGAAPAPAAEPPMFLMMRPGAPAKTPWPLWLDPGGMDTHYTAQMIDPCKLGNFPWCKARPFITDQPKAKEPVT